MKNIALGLSYDDILLVPKKAIVNSRKEISTATRLSKNIKLNIPIVSANMDSVTESEMAIAMARLGGIGIIHRFLSIKEQAQEVAKVKRADNLIIENPYTITAEKTLAEAKAFMEEKGVHGLLVIEGEFLRGIITGRDVIFQNGDSANQKLVSELMTTYDKLYLGKEGITIQEAKEIFKLGKVEKLPIVDEFGKLKGLLTQKDIIKIETYPFASRDKKGRLIVGAAIGIKDNFLEHSKALVNAGVDVIVIDVAHGHAIRVIDVLKQVKTNFPEVDVIAGNVATAEATQELIQAGADAIKVGVGPGCFVAGTRILMSNGIYKNIEDIKKGDYVINKEGNPVKVIKSFSTGIKKVIKLRNSIFYEDTFVTPEHKFWIGDLNTSSIKTLQSRGYAKLLGLKSKTIPKISKFKWKEVNSLEQDVLLLPRKINFDLKDSFEIVLKKRNKGNWRTGYNYEIDTVLKPNYDLGYVFGTFLGDGSAHTAKSKNSSIGSVRWYFGKHESKIVKKLTKCIQSIFDKECKIYPKDNIFHIIFYYKPFADFLKNFDKKQNKNLPPEFLVGNKEYLRGLLNGLIDSDGHIEKGGRIRFNNTSKGLIELFCVCNYLLTGVFPNCIKKQ
ncbi:MAG: IMP dehydrogenase, partial [Nanoarchaeota archaeon]|nr:IMP dehydrogenase [Nanoarchaeota archaeon]